MRSTLSPAFTGKKMRLMFDLVTDCSNQVSNHYRQRNRDTNGQKIIVDIKDTFSRFTNDVIATCSFGIQVDSFQHPENEFFAMGKSVTNFNQFFSLIKVVIFRLLPNVANALKLRLLGSKITHFFESLILDTMRVRESENIFRPDMINLLMQVRQGSGQETTKGDDNANGFAEVTEYTMRKSETEVTWSDNELIAQCVMFFLAGFETSSTLLSFLTYELALNPDIQTKLCNEIDQVVESLSGKKISYDVLQSMKYLDLVVSETLRKWPPPVLTDRICNKDYNLEFDGTNVTIKKGQLLWIPIFSLHRDAKYFPEPDKFDPERFNDDNVGTIVSGSFIPFGSGPRICIGSRFALMQIKSIVFYMLKEFTFNVCEKTMIPIQMSKMSLLPKNDGIHLEIKKRTN